MARMNQYKNMSTETTSVQDAISEIEQAAANAANDVRYVDEHLTGPFGRQGDIYFDGITEVPEGAVEVDTNQLAEGDTMGSRHIATGDVKLYRPADYGQVIETAQGKCVRGFVMAVGAERCRVEHPEHATFDLPPGIYQTDHQFDPVTETKVVD